MSNNELDAMAKMAALIEPLDAAARSRAVSWLVQSFGIDLGNNRFASPRFSGAESVRSTSSEYETLGDFFHTAGPKTDREKALVVAYWLQVMAGAAHFASQEVNSELKHLGYGVSNITDALTQLMNDKPSLAIQLKKSGNSKQARKTYKITESGIRKVEEMLTQEKGQQK